MRKTPWNSISTHNKHMPLSVDMKNVREVRRFLHPLIFTFFWKIRNRCEKKIHRCSLVFLARATHTRRGRNKDLVSTGATFLGSNGAWARHTGFMAPEAPLSFGSKRVISALDNQFRVGLAFKGLVLSSLQLFFNENSFSFTSSHH